MGTAVFGLAAELTNWRRKENPLQCGFKWMLLFLLLLFLSLKLQRKEEKVLFKTNCWMGVEMTVSTLGVGKGKQGKQRAHFTKMLGGWQHPQPASRPPPPSLPAPEKQWCSTHQCSGHGHNLSPNHIPELPCEVAPREPF